MSKKLDSTNFVKCVTALPPQAPLMLLLSAVTEVPFRGLFRHKFYGLPTLPNFTCEAACCVMSLKFEPNFITICQFLNFITTPNT